MSALPLFLTHEFAFQIEDFAVSLNLLIGVNVPDLFASGTVDRRKGASGANENFRVHLQVERIWDVDSRPNRLTQAVIPDVCDYTDDLKGLGRARWNEAERLVLKIGEAYKLPKCEALGPVLTHHFFVYYRNWSSAHGLGLLPNSSCEHGNLQE